jgi:EAL domain-containing protein (putative c-di-GMP-specific phosphodiesterase class I)
MGAPPLNTPEARVMCAGVSAPDHDSTAGELADMLRDGAIVSVFQPIVDLESGALFGFEALARGPEHSPLHAPAPLFAAARAARVLAELDVACQRAAIAGAIANGIEAPLTLFVNAEPDASGFGPLPPIGPAVRGIVELTERTLTSRLAELLPAVQRARAEGWGVALDDVGADTRSLALMPLLRPDVLKLDLRLVQEQPTPEIAAIAGAVGAQAERTGATVLAEGIETPEQAEYARALGATLGQGYLFGRPQRRAASGPVTTIPLPIFTAALPHPWRTPFDLASARRPVRHGTMPLLSSITRELERQAADGHRSSLFISSFPETKDARGRLDALYDEFGSDRALAAAADDGGRAHQGMRRGVSIRDDDPLRGTLNVVVIGAHFAAMLAAREGGPAADGHPPVFDFVCTYDRDLIVECAQALMLRIAMSGAGGG